jgi:hypothetical protein
MDACIGAWFQAAGGGTIRRHWREAAHSQTGVARKGIGKGAAESRLLAEVPKKPQPWRTWPRRRAASRLDDRLGNIPHSTGVEMTQLLIINNIFNNLLNIIMLLFTKGY